MSNIKNEGTKEFPFYTISKDNEDFCSTNTLEKANKISDLLNKKKLSDRFKDLKFIDNVILSYRHDFGLLPKDEQDKLRFECKEWMRAIKNIKNNG